MGDYDPAEGPPMLPGEEDEHGDASTAGTSENDDQNQGSATEL